MKTLLVAAGLALAASTAAHAVEIPAEYHGEWCSLTGPYLTPKAQIAKTGSDRGHACGKDSDGWIKITASRYDGWEQWCKPVKIKTDAIGAHIITLTCRFEDGSKETLTRRLVTTTGTKGNGKRLYIDDLGQ